MRLKSFDSTEETLLLPQKSVIAKKANTAVFFAEWVNFFSEITAVCGGYHFRHVMSKHHMLAR